VVISPKKLAEVGSVQLLAPCQIAELAAFVFDQQVMEAVGAGDQPDQRPVGFRGRRERIGVVDHHPHFLAGAAQMHWVGERQSWLVRLGPTDVDIFNPYDGYAPMAQFFLEAFQWHGVKRGDAFPSPMRLAGEGPSDHLCADQIAVRRVRSITRKRPHRRLRLGARAAPPDRANAV